MALANVVTANNQFGFDLLRQLGQQQPGSNIFISPASIALALAMTGNGGSDAAMAAVRHTLRLPDETWPLLNEAFGALWAELGTADPQTILAMGNSLWAEPRFPFAAAFREALQQHFGAEIVNLDFGNVTQAAAAINAWVAGKTRDKITDLLMPGDLLDAVLVLVNAIYFKGIWQAVFDAAKTQPGDFYLADGQVKQIPLMRRRGEYHYAANEHGQMISLPFGNGRFSFLVLLPKPNLPLAQLQDNLTPQNWAAWRQRLGVQHPFGPNQPWDPQVMQRGRQSGLIVLPRFKLRCKQSLLGHLQALGLTTNAFPRMSATGEMLYISKVIHEAVLEVNEEGAEAAAATAVVMVRSMPDPPFEMVVNHPFFCAIQDNYTCLILFMGAVYAPEGEDISAGSTP